MSETHGERVAKKGLEFPAGIPQPEPEDEPRNITKGECLGHDEKNRRIREHEDTTGDE